MTCPRQFVGFAVLAVGVTACNPGHPSPRSQSASGTNSAPSSIRDVPPADGATRARQAAFLNRIRQADPKNQAVQRAILDEQNRLGLILNDNVDLNSVPALMKTLLTQMAKEFPSQDLAIVAYGPTDPPLMIGTGQFDARTHQMTYTRGF